jgi:hypothetical protein
MRKSRRRKKWMRRVSVDPASIFWITPMAEISSLAAAKHAAFVKARGRHYSNEAEAMKVRPVHSLKLGPC